MLEAGVYESKGKGFFDNGSMVLWIRSVDRDYSKARKKPKMYLMTKQKGEKNFCYVSGLFTIQDKTYSLDCLNDVGIKEYYRCTFEESGIRLEKGK